MFKTALTTFASKSSKKKLCRLSFSTAAEPLSQAQERLQTFRTQENDPTKHSSDSLAQFYTMPPNDKIQLFEHGGIPKHFAIQSKTFNEACLMVRRPALDVINCLKSLNDSKPAVRFVLYGKMGSGKSISLVHILHYAYKNKFLIVHVPWAGNWMRRPKEKSNSESKEGFIDLNIDAAAWLLHFKAQNAQLLADPNLRTTVDHMWSKRETTPKDSPLKELVDHGINRMKYASDCVVILAEEIKKLTRAGVCKTLVAVDGFNAFFYPKTRIYTEKKELVHPHKVVLTEAFLNLSKFDWNNAAVVLTVDSIASGTLDEESHLPRYLLGKDGFEHLDPFVPVQVPEYSEKELKSCMNYYRERKWVNEYKGQDEEVAFVSGNNPYRLMELCKGL